MTGTPVSSAARAMPAAHWSGDVLVVRGVAADHRAQADHGVEAPDAASCWATSGISNAPGTQAHGDGDRVDAVAQPASRGTVEQRLGDEVVEAAADDARCAARSRRACLRIPWYGHAIVLPRRSDSAQVVVRPTSRRWPMLLLLGRGGSARFSGFGADRRGTRSTISRPKPSSPPYLAGLLVSSRMVVMPRSTRIWAPMPYSGSRRASRAPGWRRRCRRRAPAAGRHGACGRGRCPAPRAPAGRRAPRRPRSAMRSMARGGAAPRSRSGASRTRHRSGTRSARGRARSPSRRRRRGRTRCARSRRAATRTRRQ